MYLAGHTLTKETIYNVEIRKRPFYLGLDGQVPIVWASPSKAALRLPAATTALDYMGNCIKNKTPTNVGALFVKSGNLLSRKA